jgi:ribonuclease III
MACPHPLAAVLPPDLEATGVAKRKPDLASELAERLGYHFSDGKLLLQALTHGSSAKAKGSYERLEFLGDRVLGLVVAESLYRQHGREREGKLAARHSALVRGEVCAAIAQGLGLGDFVQVGAIEKQHGINTLQSVLGDVMEAIIGAVYMDGGYDVAHTLVEKLWADVITKPDTATKDAKTFVQEWALARGKVLPVYSMVGREGPEHKPKFTVRLSIPKYGEAEGEGPSKQAAEMSAAQRFIQQGGLR